MVAVFKSINISRRRALVVDDSRIARHVLSGMLDRLDFDVETVDSAEAALSRLSTDIPHIVFMDHLLPGMQGLEAVRRLRQRADTVDMRIVMYTSQDGELFADVARVAGADDVFVKTADSRALDEILARLELLPLDADARRQTGNVAPLRPHRDPLQDKPSLEHLLEPILDRHREKLRQDLLSEFAILERYEERMRREAMRRIDEMTERAISTISQSLAHRSAEKQGARANGSRPGLRAAAIMAALCAGLAIGLATDESGSDALPLQSAVEPVAMIID